MQRTAVRPRLPRAFTVCVLGAFSLATLPLAGAQAAPAPGLENPSGPVPTTFFVHLLGLGDDFPMTTQTPDEALARIPAPPLEPTTACLSRSPGDGLDRDALDWFAYSSPSYVEYDHAVDGHPFVHPERGMGFEGRFDQGKPLVLTWYLAMATQPQDGTLDPAASALAVPDVALHAWLRTGDRIAEGKDGYRAGKRIAEGETVGHLAGPLTQTLSSTGNVGYESVGGLAVYRFTVEMPVRSPRVPADAGFGLEVGATVAPELCGPSAGLAPGTLRLYTDAERHLGLATGVLDPLRLVALEPAVRNGTLLVQLAAQSPWGNYDVDEGSLRLAIDGPGAPEQVRPVSLVQRTHEVGHAADPLVATYAWPFADAKAGAGDGVYTITASVLDDQGAAVARGHVAVQLSGSGPVEFSRCLVPEAQARLADVQPVCQVGHLDAAGAFVPGPPAQKVPATTLLPLLLLGLAALLRRR